MLYCDMASPARKIPDLFVFCVVGDGEAETGALATSWHSNKFLNPVRDGTVVPILHLNGYKIAGPTVLARLPQKELEQLFLGYGYEPFVVEGDIPEKVHQIMAGTLDTVLSKIRAIQAGARGSPKLEMAVLRLRAWKGLCIVSPKDEETFAVIGASDCGEPSLRTTCEFSSPYLLLSLAHWFCSP
jgi:xylulose-5-phosphate/fructose-6-phosphate phosphoketolase